MKIVILLLLSPMLLLFGALLKNGVLSSDPPGMKTRLKQALTRNIVETRDDHYYTELRTPVIMASREEVWQRALEAGESLGWQLHSSEIELGKMHWVITTSLLRFQDDFKVEVRAGDEQMSKLYIMSQSRKGSADLGANLAHVRSYLNAVGQQ